MKRDFHPAEYLGIFIRWMIYRLYSKGIQKNYISFAEFKRKRIGLGDVIIGLIALFVLASLIVIVLTFSR